jgi:hypothetical protein
MGEPQVARIESKVDWQTPESHLLMNPLLPENEKNATANAL